MHEAGTNSLIFECWYEPCLQSGGMICFPSCYVIDFCTANPHVLKSMIGEQHDTSVDVYIKRLYPFSKGG